MLLKKLKKIKQKLLKQKQRITVNSQITKSQPDLTENNQNHEGIDSQPLPGIKYLQMRQMASEKKYFDSADHFLNLYKTGQDLLQNEPKVMENEGETVESVQGPLETAYSEIIDEMKPKESV
ncbi:hypothetical protein NEAUS03_0266 [Nematocida ausubeli]|nr:hypothetical protein NEAUS03_0266 [Nematocida ausubeli]